MAKQSKITTTKICGSLNHHNWVVDEKHTDWDVCSKCGALRKVEFPAILNPTKSGDMEYNEEEGINGYENLGDNGDFVKQLNFLEDLKLATKDMPKRMKDIVFYHIGMLELKDLTLEEISIELDIPIITVKRDWAKAKKILQKKLGI